MINLYGKALITHENVGFLFDAFGVDRRLLDIRHKPYDKACPFRESEDDCSTSCIIGGIVDARGSKIGSSLCPIYRFTNFDMLKSHKIYAKANLLAPDTVEDL